MVIQHFLKVCFQLYFMSFLEETTDEEMCWSIAELIPPLICHEYFLKTLAIIEVSISLCGVGHDQDSWDHIQL